MLRVKGKQPIRRQKKNENERSIRYDAMHASNHTNVVIHSHLDLQY